MKQAFLWGAATSAHQVEGDNVHNDWWAWEKRTPGAPRSGQACDHYRRFKDDFALAKQLGHTAHRLSLEWSRIEYAPGEWSEKALQHYREVLTELKRQGLASFVTLHHYTNPQWFAEQGGWAAPAAVARFEQYVRVVIERLGDLVDFWVTINEPNVYALKSYGEGSWPPQQRSVRQVLRVLRHLSAAHNGAYLAIHQRYPHAPVGIANSFVAFLPARPDSVTDRWLAALHHRWYNHRFFSQTRGRHDFIGLNYYFPSQKQFTWRFPFARTIPLSLPTSDLGWAIYPQGLTDALLDAHQRYRLPVYITENGIANAADAHRSEFIRAHVRAIEEAQAAGADVRGYLHWSLLDNFEWADGYNAKFGLVAVDFATQARTVRPSARVLQAIIEQSRQA